MIQLYSGAMILWKSTGESSEASQCSGNKLVQAILNCFSGCTGQFEHNLFSQSQLTNILYYEDLMVIFHQLLCCWSASMHYYCRCTSKENMVNNTKLVLLNCFFLIYIHNVSCFFSNKQTHTKDKIKANRKRSISTGFHSTMMLSWKKLTLKLNYTWMVLNFSMDTF